MGENLLDWIARQVGSAAHKLAVPRIQAEIGDLAISSEHFSHVLISHQHDTRQEQQ
jgi:hypothetical protein